MPRVRFLTITEQVAEHLRGELLVGRWKGALPGLLTIAEELGVNHKTVGAALRILEREGVLVGQGPGRKRRIHVPDTKGVRRLRVGILVPFAADCHVDYIVQIRHSLAEAGHDAIVLSETRGAQPGGRTPVKRLAHIRGLVEQAGADAWVVPSAAREVLEWFSVQPMPCFALFGRQDGVAIAGCRLDKKSTFSAVARKLIELGHRRIVLLCRKMRRLPEPGEPEQAFLDELEAHGIQTGPYHLPDWEESIDGFYGVLDSLFQHTPPTAMIIDEAICFVATQQFLATRTIRVPQQVSLVCSDPDPSFAWCRPSIAHMSWDLGLVVRRIVRWAAAVSHGKQDASQTIFSTQFVDGGTVGPVGGAWGGL